MSEHTDLLRTVARLERELAALQADRQRPYVELRGTASRRARLGLQDDGSWGIRVWNSAGTLILNTTGA